jgi:uncharacterized protein
MSKDSKRGKQGFASMDETLQREIASKGGQSVPAKKRGFYKNRKLAKEVEVLAAAMLLPRNGPSQGLHARCHCRSVGGALLVSVVADLKGVGDRILGSAVFRSGHLR